MFKNILRSWYTPVLFCFFLFFILFYSFKPISLNGSFDIILGIASFLFGFYIVFAINNTKSQHEAVMNHLKNSEGILITIQAFTKVLEKEDREKVINQIDKYLISTIDYKLLDYDKSHREATNLLNVLQDIETKDDKQNSAIEDATDTLEILLNDRVKIETVLQDRITKLEWSIIIGLFCILLLFVSTVQLEIMLWQQAAIKATIATALSMMLVILHKFDNYKWNENKLIWDRLTTTFQELGLLPYYPEEIYLSNYKYKNLDYDCRIAHYPDVYPDMKNKRVKIIYSNDKNNNQ